MKHVLTEHVDFQFGTTFGIFSNQQTIIQLHNGLELRNLKNPRPNTIVLLRRCNQLFPVLIIDGEYELNGRCTNEWKWKEIYEDGLCSYIVNGNGDFFEPHKTYLVVPEEPSAYAIA